VKGFFGEINKSEESSAIPQWGLNFGVNKVN
jgi:hypothetical protein